MIIVAATHSPQADDLHGKVIPNQTDLQPVEAFAAMFQSFGVLKTSKNHWFPILNFLPRQVDVEGPNFELPSV